MKYFRSICNLRNLCPLSHWERVRVRAMDRKKFYLLCVFFPHPHPLPLSHCERGAICNFQFSINNLQSIHKKKHAFSILEVILALAILTGAIAVLGELGRIGFRNAKASQDLTRAELLCESKMAEFTSGVTVPQAVQGVAFDPIDQDSDTPWVYSVDMQQVDPDGLLALHVTVTQNLPGARRPLSFSLTRWIIDPTLTSTTASTQASNTSTSGTGTSNAQ
jgi:general secretion pathway protein I